MLPVGSVTVKLGAFIQQTFNPAVMGRQSRGCPETGQLGGPDEEEQPRREELHAEARLRIADLTISIPAIQIKHASHS